MRYESDANIKWQKGDRKEHRIEIDLDLTVDDFLEGHSIPRAITDNETELRKQLFNVVLNHVLKDAVIDSGVPWQIPGQWHAESSTHIDNKWTISDPKIAQESVAIQNRMKVFLDVKVDRSVNAMQAIRAANHSIAVSVTDSVMDALKNRYLAITSTKTETDTSIEGGELTKFDVRSTGPGSR